MDFKKLLECSCVEDVYKFICIINQTYNVPKKTLIEMWCKTTASSTDLFLELADLDLATCDSCGKEQFVPDTFNFHCNYCPHYYGPAQCNNYCCIYLLE